MMCLQAPALVGLGIKGGLLMMATREMLAHGSPEQPDPTCCPNCNGAGCVRDGTLGSDGVPPTCLACGVLELVQHIWKYRTDFV